MHIKDFTLEKYESGELLETVPRFKILKNIIENDRVHHNNDSVYNHTLNVARSITDIAESNILFSRFFSRKVKISRVIDLVTAAALFHDVGKVSTYKVSDGISSCEGHEEASYHFVSDFFDNVEGDPEEKAVIVEIVKKHAVFYPFMDPGNTETDNDFKILEKQLAIYPELLLFCMGDIRGSQLKDNDLQLYQFKYSLLYEKLKTYIEGAAVN